MIKKLLLPLAIGGIILGTGLIVWADTHTVTSTLDDSGAGTLRNTIAAASAGDTIVFQAGLGLITVATPIIIDKQLDIEGGGTQVIGGNARANICLVIQAYNCIINKLAVINSKAGIQLDGPYQNNQILGCRIGTDWSNTSGLGNTNGIILYGNNNLIGNGTVADRNIISGNTGYGIRINSSSSSNSIKGNFIGLASGGASALANSIGISLNSTSQNQIGGTRTSFERNVISGNTNYGIQLTSSSDNNIISGNYIGTNASGIGAVANGGYGIYITSGIGNQIGCSVGLPNSALGNLISGNTGGGLNVSGTAQEVIGNLIGINVNDVDLPNSVFALKLTGSSSLIENNIICGTGIMVDLSGTFGNTLVANRFGVLPSGLPSSTQSDIIIENNSYKNWIGLPGGNGNLLYNTSIFFNASDCYSDAILGNTITGFSGKGIDLSHGGAGNEGNSNKAGPIINAAGPNLVRGKSSNGDLVELFLSQSGNGSSLRYLGAAYVYSNNDWEIAPIGGLSAGQYVSAIATDPANNSSELIMGYVVGGVLLSTSTPTKTPTNTRTSTLTATTTNTATLTVTPTPTLTNTFTNSQTITLTPNITLTTSITTTATITPTCTTTQTITATPSITATATITPTLRDTAVSTSTLTMTAISSAVASANQIIVYPIPANTLVHFAFNSPDGGDATTILVYNTHYMLVKKITGQAINGQGIMDWDVSGIAPGIYFYQVTVGSKKFPTNKLVIAR